MLSSHGEKPRPIHKNKLKHLFDDSLINLNSKAKFTPIYDEENCIRIIDEKKLKPQKSHGMLSDPPNKPEFITNPYAGTIKKAKEESALDVLLMQKNNKQFGLSSKKRTKKDK